MRFPPEETVSATMARAISRSQPERGQFARAGHPQTLESSRRSPFQPSHQADPPQPYPGVFCCTPCEASRSGYSQSAMVSMRSQPASSQTSKTPATAHRRPIPFLIMVSTSWGLTIPFCTSESASLSESHLKPVGDEARHLPLNDDGPFADSLQEVADDLYALVGGCLVPQHLDRGY